MAICCGEISSYKQDSLWSWFICCCTLICWMLSLGFCNAFGVIFPVLMDSFKETRENIAWVTSIVNGIFLLLGPVMGALLNRFGFRVTIIVGCLSCSAGLAMGSFVPSIATLYIAYSLPFAVGTSLISVSAPIVVNYYFTKRRSVALGLVTTGPGLGMMALGPSLQVLLNTLHWRNTFRLFAGLLAVTSLLGWFIRGQEILSTDERNKGSSKKFRLNLSLLKSPYVLVLFVTSGIFVFSRTVPYVHLIKYCDDVGIPAEKSSTGYLFFGIFSSLGRLGGGFLCDIECINTRLLLQATIFIMGASTMLLALVETYGALVAYIIVFSVADGVMLTTFFIECLKSVEEWEKASVFGLNMMFSSVFALSSPPLTGLMADKFGNYISAFLVAGGVGIIGSLIPFVLLCVKRESREVSDRVIIEDAVSEVQWKEADGDDLSLQQLDEQEQRPEETLTRRARRSSFSSYRRRNSSFTVRRARKSSFVMAMESPFDYYHDP